MAALLKPFGNLLSPTRTVPTGRSRIDWSHPLARGLIGAWLPGVAWIDLTGNCPPMSLGATISSNPLGVGQEGPQLNGAPSGGNILRSVAPPAFKNWNNLSLYYRGTIPATISNPFNYLIFIAYAGSSPTDPFEVASIGDLNSGGGLTTVSVGWNNGAEQKGTTVNFTGSKFISCLGTFAVGGNNILYRNGQQVASNAWGNSTKALTSATTEIQINGWTFQPRPSSANCYAAYIWNRSLSASESAFLDQNPYAFLLPDEGEMPALFIAGAPPPPSVYVPQPAFSFMGMA